jgi:hypothetical protein
LVSLARRSQISPSTPLNASGPSKRTSLKLQPRFRLAISVTEEGAYDMAARTSLKLQPRFRLAISVSEEGAYDVNKRTSLTLQPRFRLAISITDEGTHDVAARCTSGKLQPRFRLDDICMPFNYPFHAPSLSTLPPDARLVAPSLAPVSLPFPPVNPHLSRQCCFGSSHIPSSISPLLSPL